jgi:hypothetical protein
MTTIPDYVTKYFWGDNLAELSWEKHQKYITETLLNRGNTEAVSWLLGKVDRNRLASDLSMYKLNPKSANFWRIYLS